MDRQTAERPGGPVYWRLRRLASPQTRQVIRRTVDGAAAPIVGSYNRADNRTLVAVTLDDGPTLATTPGMLDVLADHGATCTFFVLLNQVRETPDLVHRMVAEGHEVALHGVSHRRISSYSHRAAVAYLRSARAELEEVTGCAVRYYRPPYGALSLSSFAAVRRAGMSVVVWSADAADWVDRPLAQVVDDAVANVGPGGILLLHERLEPDPGWDAPQTSFDRVAMLDQLLTGLWRRGSPCVTVTELLTSGRPSKTVWFRP